MAEHLKSEFLTTAWTLIEGASGDGDRASSSLARLCETYRYPVYAFIRKRYSDREEASDLCQAFFADLILGKKVFKNAQREGGRFRSYLLACVKNFLAGDYQRNQALKRGGAIEHLSLDELEERFIALPDVEVGKISKMTVAGRRSSLTMFGVRSRRSIKRREMWNGFDTCALS